ncbi:MAG: transposase [Candidatus Korobacteraceae bacterium]
MSRHRLEVYLDKVFGFSSLVSALPEGRQFPQHPWKKVFDAVFLGAAMQIPSLLQIEAECCEGALSKRIGPISDDTIGYALERQSPEPVFALSCEIARRLKRNGVLRSDWSRGLVVAAVDGIEICSSFVRCCDACMEREIEHKVNGEMRTDIQYYHRIAVVAVVSTSFPIPLGLRFQKNGEGEVACALALLQDLDRQLGRRFLDMLVGDALYLQAPFVKEVERLSLDWAFTLKQNQPELLREAERCTQESPAGVHTEPDREIRYWHLPEIDWPVADRSVQVVKTVRIEHRRRVTVGEKDGRRIKTKMAIPQQSTNFYATNFELGSVSPLFIHQFSRSRWRIDTEVFQTITTDCHLKHPAVHQTTALVVLTMIRFLAYTLSLVFYHRQIRSHARGKCETFHECAKRIAYWFVAPAANTS